MTCGFSNGRCCLIKTAPWRNIEFTADNRFDAVGIGLFIKINRAEHIAMVGDGHSRHCVFFGLFKEVIQTDHAVKKAVLRMNVQMDEI